MYKKEIAQIGAFFKKHFWYDYRTQAGLWIILSLIAFFAKSRADRHNNFLVYKYEFWHTFHLQPLYEQYPQEYLDINYYGPLFSLIVAPFAIIPEWLGLLLWLVALSVFLYVAVRRLPLAKRQHAFIIWFSAHELLTALFMQQFNIAVVALIVLTYVCIEKEKDFWAAFFIMIGVFVKLYGIVGLAFFFFSKHKLKFVGSCVLWALVLFVLPMCISTPDFVMSQYVAWFESLSSKNAENLFALSQNVSLLGMIRKISGNPDYSDLGLIIGGIILFVLPYLRVRQYRYKAFREMWLASVLMFVVLFSTGTESSTYIIAFIGVSVWYIAVPWKRSRLDLILLILVFVLSSLSPSDLFPKPVRELWVKPYALKALPVVLVWLKLLYEMYKRDYNPIKTDEI